MIYWKNDTPALSRRYKTIRVKYMGSTGFFEGMHAIRLLDRMAIYQMTDAFTDSVDVEFVSLITALSFNLYLCIFIASKEKCIYDEENITTYWLSYICHCVVFSVNIYHFRFQWPYDDEINPDHGMDTKWQ